MNYYNEFDPKAAAWLRELIKEGLIPDGYVDERDIREVRPSELDGYVQHHFFAGIGGWPYALGLAAWPGDRECWTGSCPCQPFSVAGKGAGTKDERHLWPAFRWLIAQRRPSTVFGEQVASKAGRGWIAGVQADLEALGYVVGRADVCAAGIGAPHIRQRLWWVAESIRQDELRILRGGGEGVEQRASRGLPILDSTGSSGRVADSISEGLEVREGQRQDSRTSEDAQSPTQLHGTPGFWSNSTWHPCRDGKVRRIPIEPSFFSCLPDGLSAIMGDSWNTCLVKTKERINYYATETSARPGKVLREMWEVVEEKTIREDSGGHDSFQIKKILLVALCKLAGDTQSKDWSTAQNILDLQERTMRTVWPKAEEITTSPRSSHQRRLAGSFPKQPENPLRGVPLETTHSTGQDMLSVRREGTETFNVSEALSEVEKIWQSAFYKGTSEGYSKQLSSCVGVIDALRLFPLCKTVPGRVGLLKGAGNAIVPQCAEIFIRSFLDTE